MVTTINLCTIFFISGLTLDTAEALGALKAPKGLLSGLILILGVTPMLGFGMKRLPLSEAAFATGFAIFCAVPTTLSSGVALVQSVCYLCPRSVDADLRNGVRLVQLRPLVYGSAPRCELSQSSTISHASYFCVPSRTQHARSH
jgi:predicted Na+-dependent transporter